MKSRISKTFIKIERCGVFTCVSKAGEETPPNGAIVLLKVGKKTARGRVQCVHRTESGGAVFEVRVTKKDYDKLTK